MMALSPRRTLLPLWISMYLWLLQWHCQQSHLYHNVDAFLSPVFSFSKQRRQKQTGSNTDIFVPSSPLLDSPSEVTEPDESISSSSSYLNGQETAPPSNFSASCQEINAKTVVKKDKKEIDKNNVKKMAPTAPEVNQWTSFIADEDPSNQDEDDALLQEKKLEQFYQDLKDMSNFDKWQVDQYWDRIMPTVAYLGTEKCAQVYNALRVAYRAHRGQLRKSGEPFIIHPIEVALLLSGLKMDAATVTAGLLHDTVEDTDLTFSQVESIFGQEVRSIVEGETKVSKMPTLAIKDNADEQAENLRQMFIAMTDDYRIIIVKLADRLHNMRTLKHMKPQKQIKISRETLDIFAPLAHRMGIWQFKSELEDTAFMYLYPQEYKRLDRLLRHHQTKYRETLEKSRDFLTTTLNADATLRDHALDVRVCGRTKELYSLWHKMASKGEQDFDRIMDVVALRVIITPKPQTIEEQQEQQQQGTDRGVWLCYHTLGLVQHLPGFQPVPTRVKDYISFPKPNGYQSLHTSLILNGQTIEVQIRTNEMHQIAEYGMASHWAYKESKQQSNNNKPGRSNDVFNTPWLASIKEWQDDLINSRDFVDSVRRELLGKRVFVFLRNGKILNLARGATAIDAAFHIHTEVGLGMHGAEINGKRVPFSYELQNGDVVSILTGNGEPSTDWMRYAKSRSTRSKLRSYFRAKERENLRQAGADLILDFLTVHKDMIQKESYLQDVSIPTTLEGLEEFIPGKSSYTDMDDLLMAVADRNHRKKLYSAISKIFLVPQSKLVAADRDVFDFSTFNETSFTPNNNVITNIPSNYSWIALHNSKDSTVMKNGKSQSRWDTAKVEFADPEQLCELCLPIVGDDVIGTKITKKDETSTTVHRVCCPYAQLAINAAYSKSLQLPETKRLDSVSLRVKRSNSKSDNKNTSKSNDGRFSSTRFHSQQEDMGEPVKLQWLTFDPLQERKPQYMTEVVVIANDRKLLLADCSEVVSELSEIVKTGSATTREHATLVFLIKVFSLDHLQNLMNRLRQIESVMSVERRFGSELLE